MSSMSVVMVIILDDRKLRKSIKTRLSASIVTIHFRCSVILFRLYCLVALDKNVCQPFCQVKR